MKKLLWTSAMALTAVACLTACDDSTGGTSNAIASYKAETALPDTCEMEVAKAGDTYFACFDNKWVEVTDSATVEKFKEGLDEEELKKKLEELEEKLEEAMAAAKKPSSSSKKVASSADADEGDVTPESSASEEECTGRRCGTGNSSSSKKSSGGSGNGGSGSGDSGSGSGSGSSSDSGVGSSDSDDGSSSSAKNSSSSVKNSSSSVNNSSSSVSSSSVSSSSVATCGTNTYDPSTQFCYGNGFVFDKCGTKAYTPKTQYCSGTTVGTYAISSTSVYVRPGYTLVVELNKTPGEPNLAETSTTYIGATLATTTSGGVKVSVTNKKAFTTDTKTVTLKISNTYPNGYAVVFEYDLIVLGSNMGLCGKSTVFNTTIPKQVCDSRGEGDIYNYVTIDGKNWMAENLRYDNGDNACWDGTKYVKAETEYCKSVGRFYTWYGAIARDEDCKVSNYSATACKTNLTSQEQGICPDGWHVASAAEFSALFSYVGGTEGIIKLRSTSGWKTTQGTNDYGFDILPYEGREFQYNSFSEARFWTSTEKSGTSGGSTIYWGNCVIVDEDGTFRTTCGDGKDYYYAIRCVKN